MTAGAGGVSLGVTTPFWDEVALTAAPLCGLH